MSRSTISVLFLVTLVLTSAFSPAAASSNSPVQWLHSAGTQILDESGNRVIIYGTNLVYGQGQTVTLADMQAAKSLGFNAVRVHELFWGMVQPYNESIKGIDEQYFVTGVSTPLKGVHPVHPPLDSIVNLAVQENMYVIICLWAWSGWYVPPKWAFPSIPHTGNNVVWGSGSSQRAQSEQAYSAIVNGTAAKERTGLINTWYFIANRYRNVPNVVFELLNEPFVSNTALAGSNYETFNEQVISAIESAESRPHLKMVQLLRDHGDQEIVQGAADINKPNVIWATHHFAPMDNYDPSGRYWHDSFTYHGQYFPGAWGNGTLYVTSRLARVANQISAWNKPWTSTEFSKKVDQTYWQRWLNLVLSLMAEYNISGWTWYCYSSDPTKETGWNIEQSATTNLIMSVLNSHMTTSATTYSLSLSFSITSQRTMNLTVLVIQGSIVQSKAVLLSSANPTVTVSFNGLSAGVYTVSVSGYDQTMQRRYLGWLRTVTLPSETDVSFAI